MWAGRHVVLGVSGGIASYKSCILVRRLVEAGAAVDVVLTPSAAELVGPSTFEGLTGRRPFTSLWEQGQALAHLRLAGADLFIVAPATAHLLARAALGLADELLTSAIVARQAPVLFAPAMNDAMYAAPATQQNIQLLVERGHAFVGPDTGALAEGPSDRPGRMSEPEVIFQHAARLLRRGGPLNQRSVVVTAGPTRERIDPVRVITNRSSGKMGFELARAAWIRGASVRLIAGPSAEPVPSGVLLQRVETTREMRDAVASALPEADLLIMAAAPADYRPTHGLADKSARASGTTRLELEPTEDILAGTLGSRKPGALMVGFALETSEAESKGREKLEKKQLDLIVVNDALEPGAGAEGDTNRVIVLDRKGGRYEFPLGPKSQVAESILDRIEAHLGS